MLCVKQALLRKDRIADILVVYRRNIWPLIYVQLITFGEVIVIFLNQYPFVKQFY
jgi:hypothetical protein